MKQIIPGAWKIPGAFPDYLVAQCKENLIECPARFVHWKKYQGTPQKNIGFREYYDSPAKRVDYNVWFALYCCSVFARYVSVMVDFFKKPVVHDPTKSLPVFHILDKQLSVEGAHTDLGPFSVGEKYFDDNKYTALTYLKVSEKGGRLILYGKDRDVTYVMANPGDMVIFKSGILHDIEPFNDGDVRITMVCQFEELRDEVRMFI